MPKPKKIDHSKYYIVDSINLYDPRLLWNEFQYEEDADDAIFKYLDNSEMRYTVCKGSFAKIHKLRFYWDLTFLHAKDPLGRISEIFIPKYDIPWEKKQLLKDRKHYRRLIRRRLRNLELE